MNPTDFPEAETAAEALVLQDKLRHLETPEQRQTRERLVTRAGRVAREVMREIGLDGRPMLTDHERTVARRVGKWALHGRSVRSILSKLETRFELGMLRRPAK
ncbi:MAG: hypothetical protein JOZ69_16590 [Myxococcales bacterium]|nr:hypothetical protein [Myxococcales bacterium]